MARAAASAGGSSRGRGARTGQGILRLRGTVARGNVAALALLRGLGDVVASRSEGSAVEVVVRLA